MSGDLIRAEWNVWDVGTYATLRLELADATVGDGFKLLEQGIAANCRVVVYVVPQSEDDPG